MLPRRREFFYVGFAICINIVKITVFTVISVGAGINMGLAGAQPRKKNKARKAALSLRVYKQRSRPSDFFLRKGGATERYEKSPGAERQGDFDGSEVRSDVVEATGFAALTVGGARSAVPLARHSLRAFQFLPGNKIKNTAPHERGRAFGLGDRN